MGIRSASNTKNRLGAESELALVPNSLLEAHNPLRFRTAHKETPMWVDLTAFAIGQDKPKQAGGNAKWLGALNGRPELIAELAPAVRERCMYLAAKSCLKYIESLRAWWRLFDELEAKIPAFRLTSVEQLTDLPRQLAMDAEMPTKMFAHFLSIANITRQALGLKTLHWQIPRRGRPLPSLAGPEHFARLRHAFRRRWFNALDRWELADKLLRNGAPLVCESSFEDEHAEQERAKIFLEQRRLLQNYQRFRKVVIETGEPIPTTTKLRGELAPFAFNSMGYNVSVMFAGTFPTADDIRSAFHLCLATTGWNPAVLLSLDVTKNFLEPHDADEKRYVLRGTKARAGDAEQVSEGQFKTEGSAGFILQTLIARTAPLREQLHQRLAELRMLRSGYAVTDTSDELLKLDKNIVSLAQAVRSPWLYAQPLNSEGIVAVHLSSTNYANGPGDKKKKIQYLPALIEALNKALPPKQQIPKITSNDLRKAYAHAVYQVSGGSILAVFKALGHRQVQTTVTYLHNTLLNEEHRQLFGTFSNALWGEMLANARVDPTVLAKWSRDGEVTTMHRERLDTYRTLMRSRIGIGCKDPHNPPKHIAPDFKADGKALCGTQRCLLCLEHAVILPESLSGMCKRLCELRQVQTRMGVGPFELMSRYPEEMQSLELALLAFDQNRVDEEIAVWQSRIDSGKHRVIEFDGV